MSHTVPDLPRFVQQGTIGIIKDIRHQINNLSEKETDKINTLKSMILCLDGLDTYAANLVNQAEKLSAKEKNPKRKKELEKLAEICRHVPANPARTLDEAVNSAWITFIGIIMENNNVSLSPGRLDQLFQPYFENDLKKITSEKERKEYIEHAIELISCFFMANSEHYNLVPDVANYLFGGSQSETAFPMWWIP